MDVTTCRWWMGCAPHRHPSETMGGVNLSPSSGRLINDLRGTRRLHSARCQASPRPLRSPPPRRRPRRHLSPIRQPQKPSPLRRRHLPRPYPWLRDKHRPPLRRKTVPRRNKALQVSSSNLVGQKNHDRKTVLFIVSHVIVTQYTAGGTWSVFKIRTVFDTFYVAIGPPRWFTGKKKVQYLIFACT